MRKDFRKKHENIVKSYEKAMIGLDKDIRRDFVKSLNPEETHKIDTGLEKRIFLEGNGDGDFYYADQLRFVSVEEFKFEVLGRLSGNPENTKVFDWDNINNELKFQIHDKLRENYSRFRRTRRYE